MGEVKDCPRCIKTIDEELAMCWDCWNMGRIRKLQYHCHSCGIDVPDRYANKECSHKGVIKGIHRNSSDKPKLMLEEYKALEYREYDLMYTDESDWTKFGQMQVVSVLHNLIDHALAEGDKDAFIKYANQLNELNGLRTNAEV